MKQIWDNGPRNGLTLVELNIFLYKQIK